VFAASHAVATLPSRAVIAKLKGKRFGRPLTAAKKSGQIRKLYRARVSKAEIARTPISTALLYAASLAHR
jgi:hypothetical protein